MIAPFVHQTHPARIVFGAGSFARLGEEVARLGLSRVLVLSTPQQADLADRAVAALGGRAAGAFAGAAMHTPVEVTARAVEQARALGADGTLAVGGGSTTGLGKAIAIRLGTPQIVLPTTYAGSEMTPILGETAGGAKTTRSDPAILPGTVIYDVDLTLGLPVGLSMTSGINAMAHAVEALYARDRNPVVSALAERAIAGLGAALPAVAADPGDRAARAEALLGACLAGICLGSVGMAIHHKLCHVLGGMFDLPHAETHAVLLPHAVAYVAPAAPEAMAAIERALGVPDAATGLFDLGRGVGAPISLREIGMPREGLHRATKGAVQNPYWNPRPVEEEEIRILLWRAFNGERPEKRKT